MLCDESLVFLSNCRASGQRKLQWKCGTTSTMMIYTWRLVRKVYSLPKCDVMLHAMIVCVCVCVCVCRLFIQTAKES